MHVFFDEIFIKGVSASVQIFLVVKGYFVADSTGIEMNNFGVFKGKFIDTSNTSSPTSSPPAAGGGVKILFENELGMADFHLPSKSCILYVSECDIIAGSGYKRKLVRYRNVSLMHENVSCLLGGALT